MTLLTPRGARHCRVPVHHSCHSSLPSVRAESEYNHKPHDVFHRFLIVLPNPGAWRQFAPAASNPTVTPRAGAAAGLMTRIPGAPKRSAVRRKRAGGQDAAVGRRGGRPARCLTSGDAGKRVGNGFRVPFRRGSRAGDLVSVTAFRLPDAPAGPLEPFAATGIENGRRRPGTTRAPDALERGPQGVAST